MVVVKVRETYDLRTVKDKMSLIAIHTPDPSIIIKNFPGLLINCKFYRPLSADVTIACASMLPADPLQVGVAPGEIAPEDLFNPICYKACTNESFSLLESRILALTSGQGLGDVFGASARIETDESIPPSAGVDDFDVYYGILSDAHGWKHANPQSGLTMRDLRPLVHQVYASFGGTGYQQSELGSGVNGAEYSPGGLSMIGPISPQFMRGRAVPMPRMPTTMFPSTFPAGNDTGFPDSPKNIQTAIPRMRTMVASIIIPPSRLHELYYRMVVEWSVEFSDIRTVSEIVGWAGEAALGQGTRFANYDFGDSKIMDVDTSMVEANIPVEKVM